MKQYINQIKESKYRTLFYSLSAILGVSLLALTVFISLNPSQNQDSRSQAQFFPEEETFFSEQLKQVEDKTEKFNKIESLIRDKKIAEDDFISDPLPNIDEINIQPAEVPLTVTILDEEQAISVTAEEIEDTVNNKLIEPIEVDDFVKSIETSGNQTFDNRVLAVVDDTSEASIAATLFPKERLSIDTLQLFNQHSGQPEITNPEFNFGVHSMLSVGENLYFGISQDYPSLRDGAVLAVHDESSTRAVLQNNINPLKEQGIHEISIADDKLVIPGTDPCCGEGSDIGQHEWAAGNMYTFDGIEGFQKHRYAEDGITPLLPDVVHSLGTWYDEKTNELYLAAGNVDRDIYGANCGNPSSIETAGCYGTLHKSRDGGKNWELVFDGRTGLDFIPWRFYDVIGVRDTLFLVAADYFQQGHLLYSTDKGRTWTEIENVQLNRLSRLEIFDDKVLAVGSPGKYLYEIDRRGRAKKIELPFAIMGHFNVLHTSAHDGFLYLITNKGNIMRSSTLRSWQMVSDFSEIRPRSLTTHNSTLYVSSTGEHHGIWKVALPEENDIAIATQYPKEMILQMYDFEEKKLQLLLENQAQSGRERLEWNVSASPDWLKIDRTKGRISRKRKQTIDITIDARDLDPQTYSGTIEITTNALNNPLITLPVNLTVIESTGASLLAPVPDKTLTRKVSVAWTKGNGPTEYILNIGTSPGKTDIYRGKKITKKYISDIELPNENQTLYGTLTSITHPKDKSEWKVLDFTFTTHKTLSSITTTKDLGSVQLEWEQFHDDLEDQIGRSLARNIEYVVHRSTTPYFTPDETTKIGTTNEHDFTDEKLELLQADAQYYYQIFATLDTEVPLPQFELPGYKVGNTLGTFTYVFAPQSITTIQSPFEFTPYTSGRTFTQETDINNVTLLYWNVDTQSWMTYYATDQDVDLSWIFGEFGIADHYPVTIQNTTDEQKNIVLSGQIPEKLPNPRDLVTGFNFIGIHPLYFDYYQTAATVFGTSFGENITRLMNGNVPINQNGLPFITKTPQGWEGEDFPVQYGYGYIAELTSPMMWQYNGNTSRPTPAISPSPTPDLPPTADPTTTPQPTEPPSPTPAVTPTVEPTTAPPSNNTISLVSTNTSEQRDTDTVIVENIPAGADMMYVLTFAARSSSNQTSVLSSVSGGNLNWIQRSTQCDANQNGEVSIWTAYGSPVSNFDVTVNLTDNSNGRVAHVLAYTGVDPNAVVATSFNTIGENRSCSGGTRSNQAKLNLNNVPVDSVVVTAAYTRNKTVTNQNSSPVFTEQAFASSDSGGSMANLYAYDAILSSPGTVNFSSALSGDTDWATAGIVLQAL